MFAVRYSDYVTIAGAGITNADRLSSAGAAQPGASMSEPQLLSCSSDTGLREDEKWEYECSLQPTAENVAALIASNFDWEETAIDLARSVSSPETIHKLLADQDLRNSKAKALLAQAHAYLGAATSREKSRSWWRFWKR
jgi:hypothetical protein